jgi:DNA-binding CsgD family transcriptional regulator
MIISDSIDLNSRDQVGKILISPILLFRILTNETIMNKSLKLNIEVCNKFNIDVMSYQHSACVKDLDGRYLFCNNSYCDLVNINKYDEYIGKTDNELMSLMTDFRDELVKQDLIIMENLREIKTLNINFFFKSDKKKIVIFSKIPIFNEQGNIAGICYIEEDIDHYYSTCSKINHSLLGVRQENQDELNLELLTTSENEVLYLLVCGYRLKEVATRLGKSYSTVRSYQQSAISKFGLFNIRQLIEHIKPIYSPRLIPDRFLSKQSIII